ncbi:MAG: hypothetical protein WAP35_00740 [Solirubrobacterales bacterium]
MRRHRPSELLTEIAAVSIAIAPDGMWDSRTGGLCFPWSLAVTARESIRAGTEHRKSGVTRHDLAQICEIYNNLFDPIADDNDVLATLVRSAFEQFPFQESLYFGIARSRLLFEKPSPQITGKLKIVDAAFWQNVTGQPLDTFLDTGLLLGVGALRNGGLFDLAWFKQPNFAPIAQHLSEDTVRTLMHDAFATDTVAYKSMCPSSYKRGLERVSFNPLLVRPFLHQADERFLAPIPQFVFWRASAPSLYYIALDHLSGSDRNDFTDDVGELFEDYVVRQALQLPLEQPVQREIEYESGKKSTDAILVWPGFILLVEAKATRLTEESRAGGSTLRTEIDRTIGRAFEQLDTTAKLIHDRHPAFDHLPVGLPIYGAVVTLEPYHFINTPLGRSEIAKDPSIPVVVTSVQNFERFVADAIADPVDANQMLELLDDNGKTWKIDDLIRRNLAAGHRNPMLDVEFTTMANFGTST